MDFKIEEQNKPKDYIINEKYRNMVNDENKYSIEEFEDGKNELIILMKNYSQNIDYNEEKKCIDVWILKFNDIIKTKKVHNIINKKTLNKWKKEFSKSQNYQL
jgi:hypothetical protein